MENITMWANKKSPSPNVAVVTAKSSTSHSTSETIIISPKDVTKILKLFLFSL